jgi:hypothetical protein
MQRKYIDFRQNIYDIMMGYTDEPSPLPVENEFEPNSRCCAMVETIYSSKSRLDALLNTEESPELNQLVDTFYTMQEHLCKKMFDYGVYFQKTGALPPEIDPDEIAECLYKK